MILTNFYSRVRQILGTSDTSGASQPAEHADAELAEYFDAACQEWCRDARPGYLVKDEPVDQTNGTAEYNGPTKAMVILRVRPTHSSALVSTKAGTRELLEVIVGPGYTATAAAQPRYWYPAGKSAAGLLKFGLWPKPASDVSGGIQVLNLNRPALASEISTGDILDIPAEFLEELALDVALRVQLHQGEVIENPQAVQDSNARGNAARAAFKKSYGYLL